MTLHLITLPRKILICSLLLTLLFYPSAARADGGMVIPDDVLWRMIEEGQQIAVVTLQSDQAAHIDLFLSFLDRSQQSHQVTFFVPLGISASDFTVVEELSTQFDELTTQELDRRLIDAAEDQKDYRQGVVASILPGTLLINGGWSWPIVIAAIVASCNAAAPPPVASFQTANSSVSIYAVDSQTDLQGLIETSGLDPGVRETLEGLRGQQIAVIKLITQPPPAQANVADDYQARQQGQPGLHLAWTTRLNAQAAQPGYTYPLGTGRAWANPIELTRVYVVAPPGMDFEVNYPRLGEDRGGLTGNFGTYYASIAYAKEAAFAVDNAVGDFGRVWRVTYIKSNAAQDILITPLNSLTKESRATLSRLKLQGILLPAIWISNLLAGIAAWVTSWRWVMNRRLGAQYRWRDRNLWTDALGWAALYPFLILVLGLGSFWLVTNFTRTEGPFMTIVLGLVILSVLGVPNLALFSRAKEKAGISRWRAVGAYLLTVLLANLAYLPLAALLAVILSRV